MTVSEVPVEKIQMKTGKTGFLLVLLFLQFSCSRTGTNRSDDEGMILWYQQPATEWTEALPVGNGRLGAMIFGGIDQERIQLNEESLWAGEPINNNNPQASTHLSRIQQLLLDGRIEEARRLSVAYLLGTPPRIRSYQTLGDLRLDFNNSNGKTTNYRRDLNLSDGIATVSYQRAGVTFTRRVFISAPDNVIVIKVNADKPGMLDLAVSLSRDQDARLSSPADNILLMQGQINDKADSLSGPAGMHMKFAVQLVVYSKGGKISSADNRLQVEKADDLTLILTAATDYNVEKLSFDRSLNPLKICGQIMNEVKSESASELEDRHLNNHRHFFNRVRINLGHDRSEQLPTDRRLQKLKDGDEDAQLVALYFQYGRYLLMGASRAPGILPANLQGIWNEHFTAPWNSDYHTNINLQMNYWPAEVCNLPETILPLSGFFTHLMRPGSVTARQMYQARGWVMHHVTDPFGRTGLMDGIQWGTSPLAGAWMTLTFWRHYEYTQDKSYLTREAFPMMQEAAQFILDFLIEDNQGRLVTAPSMSPENAYLLPGTNEKHQLTCAATIDIQIIHELFNACIKASEILGQDPDFAGQLKETLARLPAVKVGRDSTIQEWIEDYQEAEPGHRHMSHLFGLHPGTQITPDTPVHFKAAARTIEKRLAHGGGHTGWSRAWIINFYARLLDGEAAYQHVLALLRKSTLTNLFDTHPPFQIDGNFGGTAGIAEMLLQSQNGDIHLLPALPGAWPQGYIKGLKARGNFEVDIFWTGGKLKQVTIKSLSGGKAKIKYKNEVTEIETEKGGMYQLNGDLSQD